MNEYKELADDLINKKRQFRKLKEEITILDAKLKDIDRSLGWSTGDHWKMENNKRNKRNHESK
jgi:hypothetical protein